ncbi:MAG TPA: PAS domain S-box protein [Thermoanaerobaculia bacterium]|jgi:PAS domain S-box-containing protein
MTDVFRRIVQEASEFAIILLDTEGRIELWNSGAEAIFGYSPDEVKGQHFELLFVHDDRTLGMPAKELEHARADGRAEDTRWHLHKSGRWMFMDGVTTPLRDEAGRITGFSKFARDVTDRQRTESRIAAQLALTNLLRIEQPFDQTARLVMQAVCENLGWDVGMLWEAQNDEMVCIDHWHAPLVDGEAATALCEGGRLARGLGLVGQVLATGEAVWVPRFRDAERYPRAPLAERAGMLGAFAFPITAAGRVLGALEFFSREEREPDQALIPIMTLIGAQIGDFIERRRTQELLRESEERYRLVSETAQDAIFTIDEQSTITFCNPAVERMFGYKAEELIGHKLDVIIPERLRDAHRRGIDRYLRTRTKNIPWTGVELPALHKDGREFPCELSFGEWARDGQTIFTGFARDVTERKRALEIEQQARAEAEATKKQLERRADEEASFRHLASALTGAVEMTEVLYEITNRATLVTRADGVYVERIAAQGGVQQVEVVSSAGRGAPPRGLRVAFPGSMTDEILQGGSPVILTSMDTFGRNMAPYLSDTCAECEVLVTPLVAEKEPLGALVLLNSRASGRHFRDTDVVRARTLGDLASLALRRVRLMEQEREAKEKAEAAVRVRDETLGIVSHDLRNPLTTIALSADLLAGAPSAEQPELIETIRTSARRMQRLIQDLLDVARVEAGGLAVAASLMEPEPLVREVLAAHEQIAEQKKQRIACDIRGALPRICADRDRLVQVLGNLLGNAVKFTPERGVIHVETKQRDGQVFFVVRDTGPGIPEADLKNVFTPYWQAKKTAHMGAGLGLAIVRGIVEAHGGRVWAENAPGGGAMFTFTIPAE